MANNTATAAHATQLLADVLEVLKSVDLSAAKSEHLVPLANAVKDVAAFTAAIHDQINLRAVTLGELVPGAALKDSVVHRKWHDDAAAEALAFETFGDKAFTRALKSPAQIEKMEGGATFVAVAAYKPDAPKKVVY